MKKGIVLIVFFVILMLIPMSVVSAEIFFTQPQCEAFEYERGKNLFNKNTVILDSFINKSDVINPSTENSVSDFIKIKPNTSLVIQDRHNDNSSASFCWYDANKNHIDGQIYDTLYHTIFTSPENAYYIRISVSMDMLNDCMVFLGSAIGADYEPYYIPNTTKDPNVNNNKTLKLFKPDLNNSVLELKYHNINDVIEPTMEFRFDFYNFSNLFTDYISIKNERYLDDEVKINFKFNLDVDINFINYYDNVNDLFIYLFFNNNVLKIIMLYDDCFIPFDDIILSDNFKYIEISFDYKDYYRIYDNFKYDDDINLSLIWHDDLKDFNDIYNSAYNIGYNNGYDDGEVIGYDDGYDDGYGDGEVIGYDDGYDDGQAKMSKAWDNLIPSIVGSLASFFLILFSVPVFNTTLLSVLATVGMFLLVVALINRLRG